MTANLRETIHCIGFPRHPETNSWMNKSAIIIASQPSPPVRVWERKFSRFTFPPHLFTTCYQTQEEDDDGRDTTKTGRSRAIVFDSLTSVIPPPSSDHTMVQKRKTQRKQLSNLSLSHEHRSEQSERASK